MRGYNSGLHKRFNIKSNKENIEKKVEEWQKRQTGGENNQGYIIDANGR